MEQVSRKSGFGQVKKLPEASELGEILQSVTRGQVSMTTTTFRHFYPDVMTFLRTQKETGAGQSENKKAESRRSLQKFIQTYENLYSCSEGIPVTYKIAYFQGQYLPPNL